jgi:hypothetical protein
MPDHRPKGQAFVCSRFMRACIVLLLLLLPLAACGKKPGQVDPPPGIENDAFPKAYPDPSTDPKP